MATVLTGVLYLQGLNSKLQNLEPLFREIGEYLVTETGMRFETETGPDKKRWLPSKAAQKRGGKTLTHKAILKQAINYIASTDGVAVGVGVFPPYARIHQFGGKTGRGHAVSLPARPYLGVNEEDADEINQIVIDYLKA